MKNLLQVARETIFGDSRRDARIDALKGVLIIFVLILHVYSITPDVRLKYLYPFWAKQAVPGFLFISGLLAFVSFKTRLQKGCAWIDFARKIPMDISRYYLPFVLIYIIELVLRFKYFGGVTFGEAAAAFALGGWGPGSYYLPVLAQLSVLMPCICFAIHKLGGAGCVFVILFDLAFEFLQYYCGISAAVYRNMVFRYLAVVALGAIVGSLDLRIIAEKCRKKAFLVVAIGAIFGGAAIWCAAYGNIIIVPIDKWRETSMLTVPYASALIFMVLLLWGKVGIVGRVMAVLGRCSLEIFLFQMSFYMALHHKWIGKLTGFADIVVSILICALIGVAYHIVFETLRKKLGKKLGTVP